VDENKPPKKNRKKAGELKLVEPNPPEQKPEVNLGGRPLKPIDPEIVRNLAMIQCTMPEMAAVLDCSEDTLKRRFAGIIKEGQNVGKSSLRRHMWKKVEGGNVVMMIWLSKQILGMRDKVDQKFELPMPHEIDYSKYTDEELAQLEKLVKLGQPESVEELDATN